MVQNRKEVVFCGVVIPGPGDEVDQGIGVAHVQLAGIPAHFLDRRCYQVTVVIFDCVEPCIFDALVLIEALLSIVRQQGTAIPKRQDVDIGILGRFLHVVEGFFHEGIQVVVAVEIDHEGPGGYLGRRLSAVVAVVAFWKTGVDLNGIGQDGSAWCCGWDRSRQCELT